MVGERLAKQCLKHGRVTSGAGPGPAFRRRQGFRSVCGQGRSYPGRRRHCFPRGLDALPCRSHGAPVSWELCLSDMGLRVPPACCSVPFSFQRAKRQRKCLEPCRSGRGGSLCPSASRHVLSGLCHGPLLHVCLRSVVGAWDGPPPVPEFAFPLPTPWAWLICSSINVGCAYRLF